MSGINSVVLIGRLTADPECRKTQGGLSVCHFTIAVDRRTKDSEEKADFIRCVAWRQSADYLGQYANKGRLTGITGHIRTGSYSDKTTGKTIYTTEVECDSVTLLDSKKQTGSEEKSEYARDVEEFQQGFAQDNGDIPW